jgi:hypothetical protein
VKALRTVASLLFFACAPPPAVEAAEFSAVEKGEPVARIVITQEALEPTRGRGGLASDRQAAELLRDWIGLISGAELEITAAAEGRAIYVGAAAVEQGLDPGAIFRAGARKGTGQAFSIRVDTERILLAGETAESTVRAAAVLLESIGCRWFMEGELGRVYPSTPTVVFGELAVDSEPGFRMRRVWGGEGWARDTLWKRWHGLGGEKFQTGHAWKYFDESDFEAHPEWFRTNEEGNRVEGPWLNTGHPELRDEFAKRLLASMRPGSHPSLSPPDSHLFDHSPESTRFDDPESLEPSSGRVSTSNRFMHFANDIAKRVGEVHPDSVLGFYAYSDYSEPPTLIDRLEPNLCIWIAPIRYSRFHRLGSPLSPSRQRLERSIEGWSKIASQLGYREYNYNLAEAMTPFSKIGTWSHDIPLLASKGFIGLNLETFATWNLSLPTIYLSVRLAWDPYADSTEILEDLYEHFYGSAAAPMRQYWRELDAAWQGLPTESGSIYSLHLVFGADRLQRLDRLLREAETAAAHDDVLATRVAMARDGLDNAVDFMAIRTLLHDGQLDAAQAVYDSWLARTERAIENGTGYSYTRNYLRRFVGRTLRGLLEARGRFSDDAVPSLQVLPDQMRLAYDRDLIDAGVDRPFEDELDDSGWRPVRTYSSTLEQQGLPDRLEVMWYRTSFQLKEADSPAGAALVFATVDGTANVWVNGRLVGRPVGDGSEPAASFPSLRPFDVDLSRFVRTGHNTVTVRVDHRELRELSLGGIVAPVYLLTSR